jgi:hypothetical protein
MGIRRDSIELNICTVFGHRFPLRHFILKAIAVPIESVVFPALGAVPYQCSNNQVEGATLARRLKRELARTACRNQVIRANSRDTG